MKKPTFNRLRAKAMFGGLLLGGAALTAGCLERPVAQSSPNTSNVFVEQIVNTNIDKIDLLFVIDNSVSMADKQEILEAAVPQMVTRLVRPDCIDVENPEGSRTPSSTSAEGDPTCPAGLQLEFDPIEDIHIGVITSSIGGHGSQSCTDGESNDKALLIPKVRSQTPDGETVPPGQSGFLTWTGGGDAERAQLESDFALHVKATGESGCGFEAPLEAWYRFLVQPQPPVDIGVDPNTSLSNTLGVDQAILDQRAAFLRPDSLVAIVVLTDENDCSAMDGGNYYRNAGFGWLVSEPSSSQRFGRFPIASPACAENPNDRCCFSCLTTAIPDDCGVDAAYCGGDAPPPTLSQEQDRANVRCFDNQRRFGVNLLYPVKRYVDGLSQPEIVDQYSPNPEQLVDNPLLRPQGQPPRSPDLVFFAGIVGVPWQDISTQESLENPDRLEYLTAAELRNNKVEANGEQVDRWALILGEPNLPETSQQCQGDEETRPADCGRAPSPPLDPFMVESIFPRSGTNPISSLMPEGQVLATIPPDGTGSTINGHEYRNGIAGDTGAANDDLQYSCIFPLEPIGGVKEDCTTDELACDCGSEPDKGRPLCKPDAQAQSAATNTQYWGKAYPATRVLQVLRDFGSNSIVASICPKILDSTSTDFGYNPAVKAIVDRLAEKLGGQCLPRELTLEEDGDGNTTVPCAVVEALQGDALANCAAIGRVDPNPDIIPAVRKQLQEGGFCSDEATCAAWNLCQVPELSGEAEQRCFDSNQSEDSFTPGFCYVDPAKGPEAGGMNCDDEGENCSNDLVATCDASQRRLLRFVGVGGEAQAPVPFPDAVTFVACVGEAASEDGIPDVDAPVEPGEPMPGTGGGTSTGGGTGMGGGM